MWTLRIREGETTRDEKFSSPEERLVAALRYSERGIPTLGIEPDPEPPPKYNEDDLFGRMGD